MQTVELAALGMLFFYIVNNKTDTFNNFTIPLFLKISVGLLILTIFISAVSSPHISELSIYLAFLFYLFLFTSYYCIRSIVNELNVEQYLLTFVYCVYFTSLTIIIQIIISGNLRSMGLAGFAIIDFTVMASLILIFLRLFHDKIDLKNFTIISLIIIVMLTTQSRFAWLSFVISIIYGTILSYYKFQKDNTSLKKKILILTSLLILFAGILSVTGLGNIFTSRISQININFFQANEGDSIVSNSLESRLLIWVTAYNAFISNPIFGIGYQMFSVVSETYNILPQEIYDIYVKDLDAHTTFLNILVDTGIIGFIIFINYILLIFRYSFKAIKISYNINERKISITLNILVFFIIINSIYSGAFTFGQNALSMHFVFGLTIGNYLFLKNKLCNNTLNVKV